MKLIVSICIIVFALISCGKKSDPKYQSKLNQVKIIL
jgi:hypothetical protein